MLVKSNALPRAVGTQMPALTCDWLTLYAVLFVRRAASDPATGIEAVMNSLINSPPGSSPRALKSCIVSSCTDPYRIGTIGSPKKSMGLGGAFDVMS